MAGRHRGVFTLHYQQKNTVYYGDPTAQPNGIRRNAQVGRQRNPPNHLRERRVVRTSHHWGGDLSSQTAFAQETELGAARQESLRGQALRRTDPPACPKQRPRRGTCLQHQDNSILPPHGRLQKGNGLSQEPRELLRQEPTPKDRQTATGSRRGFLRGLNIIFGLTKPINEKSKQII